MTNLPEIKAIYTDGACSGNPGPGGWGTVIYFKNGSVHELGGYAPATTNNRMEMQAAIAALQFLQQYDYRHPIKLNTDSKYLIQGITQWMQGWKRKGWKTAAGKAVLNKDLWLTLDDLTKSLKTNQNVAIDWQYVKGHAGNIGNERCDQIARAFSQQHAISLKKGLDSQLKDTEVTTSAPSKKPTVQKENSLSSQVLTTPKMSETRISQASNTLKLLQIADELAKQGYLITTSELMEVTGVSKNDLTQLGDDWVWRNWTISCVSGQSDLETFWQLERIEE